MDEIFRPLRDDDSGAGYVRVSHAHWIDTEDCVDKTEGDKYPRRDQQAFLKMRSSNN